MSSVLSRPRLLAPLAAALALCAATAGCGGGDGGAATASGPAAAPERDALWLAPEGDDGGACGKADPCATLTGALAHARAGQTIFVGAGRYPEQEVHGGPAGRGKRVVVRPAPGGAAPRLGKLLLHAPGLELVGLRVDGWQAFADSGRLTLRKVHTPWFYIDGASDVKLIGGTVGPADSVDPQIRAVDTNGAPVPTDILIEGVTFRDFTRHQDPTAHIECLQIGAVRRLVVRDSRFERCSEHGMFVGAWGGTATISDVTISGNRFGSVPDGFYSLRVGVDAVSDVTVRDNTAEKVLQVDPGVPHVTMERNVAPREPWECFAGQRYVANRWSNVTCSASDRKIGARAVARAVADRARPRGA